MCLYMHEKKKGRLEIEIEIGDFLFSINVWQAFAEDCEKAVRSLFESCQNPHCAYFQNRLASIELAFGY